MPTINSKNLLSAPLLGILMGLFLWGYGGVAIAAYLPFAIEQARQQPDGTQVVLQGNVTVPSGRFGSSNADLGFAIQDESGGIYVTTDFELELELGDAITVGGVLMDDGHGQRMLQLTAWQIHATPADIPEGPHSPASVPLPTAILMPQKATLQEAGSHLDGKLVKVTGKVVRPLKDDAPYGDRLWIEDSTGQIQIYIPKSTHIAPEKLPFLQPGRVIQVTGLSSQYDGDDEVIPRSLEDIQVVQ